MHIELEPDDPRIRAGLADLMRRLEPIVGREFDADHVAQACELVADHRQQFRRRYGADFPRLVPFVLPSLKYIHFVRPDIDDREIRIQLRNLIVQLSRRGLLPSTIEIVTAVRHCWPRYKPPIEEFRVDPLVKQKLN